MRYAAGWAWCLSIALACPIALGAEAGSSLHALADMSLEQLSAIPVVSVSGRPEPLSEAPASIYVITGEDIRRSTATSLPEALRLAPMLEVAQVSANVWAITARGGNSAIANKLLVLLDGRPIYSTLFAGVIWDMHDVVLEDIDRIEVVSGPGGTLWGVNAVNGVINIITRRAERTQGALVSVVRSAQGGRESVRWGGHVGEAAVRLYGIATDTAGTTRQNGSERGDDNARQQTGFRADWSSGSGHLTLQGDLSRGSPGVPSREAPEQHGGDFLARWRSTPADGATWVLQAYSSLAERNEVTALHNRSRVNEVGLRYEPRLAGGRKLLWGAGWREAADTNIATPLLGLTPAERRLSWTYGFAQLEQPLARDWTLITGLKGERNSYTGFDWMPNLRLAWRHDAEHTTWLAISRAARAPSRIDRDLVVPSQPPYMIAGGPNFHSEIAKVVELGHRGRVGNRLSWSATLYQQSFDGLRAGIPGQVPATVENAVGGHVRGLEAWGSLQLTPDWRMEAGGFVQRSAYHYTAVADPRTVFPDLGNDPDYQWSVRSHHRLPHGLALDLGLRRVGSLPSPFIPAYTSADLRLAWRIRPGLTLSLLGKNLLQAQHVEFDAQPSPSLVGREWAAKLVWTP